MSNLSPLFLVVLAAAGASATPVAAGDVKGRVTVLERGGGRVPADAAVVWLEGARDEPARSIRAEIVMRGKVFEPRTVVVPAGSTVSFPNADPILHNVFSVSRDNPFDLGLYPKGEAREVELREPGVVRVFCNVHAQMEAFIVVVPARWYARPGADGAFRIEGAPPGRYTLRAWDERGGPVERAVEVPADGDAVVDVEFDARAYKRRPHLDKHGKPYRPAGKDPY